MIDFKNANFVKLRTVNYSDFKDMIEPILSPSERIVGAYRGVRDGVVFTSKRIIAINIQGLTGKKKDFTSLPYNKIQAYSVETAGVLDWESELVLWFSSLGLVKFEFMANTDVANICKIIAENTF